MKTKRINKNKKVADGKNKVFFHMETGELISRKNWRQAFKYFKADGKRFNYATRRCDVKELKQYNLADGRN